jgi:peptide/nickel transport system permease protein
LSSDILGEAPGPFVEGPGPPVLSGHRRTRPGFMRGIPGFIVRRLLLGVVTLFFASVIIFAATVALPGDAARSILGRSATPESLAQLREQLGLTRPLVEQYTDWIGGLLHGDLGTSLAAGIPVTEVIGERIVNSAFLMLIAAIVSIPLAILLGAVSARRRDGPFDHATSLTTLGLAALPEFVVGIALVVVFATTVFHVLPAVSIIEPGTKPWEYPKELVLPIITLVIAVTPYVTRIMRASTVEILESDYVEMARLKGLSERLVLWRHAVPNGMPPTFQVIAINLAYLAGGIVVVEVVFVYPGIGSGFVDAVRARDIPVVQALALLVAALYVVLNLLADIATILVSPRLRTSLR